jgi:hypothetical protein
MIDYTLDTAQSILYVRPSSALEQEDFVELAKVADPHIEQTGSLAGLVIDAPRFPWWDSPWEPWRPTSASFGTTISTSGKSPW